MSSDTSRCLGDFVTLIRGTTYKGNLVGKPGPALLGLGSIEPGGGFREADFKTYGGDCPAKLTLAPGNLFVALKGATKDGKMIGSVARVPCSIRSGRLTQDTVRLHFTHQDKATETYIYWLLRTPQYREYCAGRATGSAVVALSREDFLSYPVPPLTGYRSNVVDLLEEIEKSERHLRETNATLEAIAQALFKSWFVDFDPVRAKLEGRAPDGMDEATAALFPDSFEESELGLVPRGWRVATIGLIAEVIDCLHAKKPDLLESGKPYLQLNNIRDDGLLDIARQAFISEQDYQKWISRIEVSSGDCVITNVGRVGAVSQVPSGFRAAMGRNMTAIRLKQNYPYPTYLIELLLSPWMKAEIGTKTDVGTILDALNVKSIPKLRCMIATTETMNAFELISRPLRASMEMNLARSQTLATLRDTLLPRLISGQLRLPEAETVLAGI